MGLNIIIEEDFETNSQLVHRFDAQRLTAEQVLSGISQVTDYSFEKTDDDEYLVIRD